jgi:transcriptional regulator with GAF, ATPase, and Fis domain
MPTESKELPTDDRLWNLERQVFQLRTLFEIAQTLTACRDSESILQQVLAVLCGTFGVERAAACVRDEEQNGWRCLALRGKEVPPIALSDYAKKSGASSLPLLRAAVMKFFELTGAPEEVAMAELRIKNRSAGVFLLGPKLSGERYQAHDLEMLTTAASFTANALDNVQLYEALQSAQEKLRVENLSLREAVKSEFDTSGGAIIGASAAMQGVQTLLRNLTRSEANVLIYGETGTGKELAARAIHYRSARADGPFIGINCAAIPESLVESEFFGIEAGVATGVRQHAGFFEQANGGTLFIDEVGDMPAASQAKLLRVIQERRLRRVGGDRELPVNVRVIAATNKDLSRAIRAGNFREDLFYRLAVLELRLPPLRERVEDIPLLANYFIQRFAARKKRKAAGISAEALRALQHYAWPGNVRELENEIERAMAMTDDGGMIGVEHLSDRFIEASSAAQEVAATHDGELRAAVDALERTLIQNALQKFRGNKSQVARALGLSRLGLQSKMNRLGISSDHPQSL